MSVAAVLERMGRAISLCTASDRPSAIAAGETSAHSREVVEAALAQKLKDMAEAAYARGDLFAKRGKLMQDWADYLATPPARVVELQRPAA
jgi:hypothetical protein